MNFLIDYDTGKILYKSLSSRELQNKIEEEDMWSYCAIICCAEDLQLQMSEREMLRVYRNNSNYPIVSYKSETELSLIVWKTLQHKNHSPQMSGELSIIGNPKSRKNTPLNLILKAIGEEFLFEVTEVIRYMASNYKNRYGVGMSEKTAKSHIRKAIKNGLIVLK